MNVFQARNKITCGLGTCYSYKSTHGYFHYGANVDIGMLIRWYPYTEWFVIK